MVNDELKELADLIAYFCFWLTSDEQEKARRSSERLQEVFEKRLPALWAHFYNQGASTPRTLIEFAVRGLNDPTMTKLWTDYFLGRAPLKRVAYELNFTSQGLLYHAHNFPNAVADLLLKKNAELAVARVVSTFAFTPYTHNGVLQQVFGLTGRQAEVLLAFCWQQHRGRRAIAADLSISNNTLKHHIRAITIAFKVDRISDAVRLVLKYFKGHPLE